MNITTTFITRYVADHSSAIAWYSSFFGREPDASPVPNCREWHQPGGVVFQVIHLPDKAGTQSFAFSVGDWEAEAERIRQAGFPAGETFAVPGFARLRYAPFSDPEGVATGLLNEAG